MKQEIVGLLFTALLIVAIIASLVALSKYINEPERNLTIQQNTQCDSYENNTCRLWSIECFVNVTGYKDMKSVSYIANR